MANGWIPVTEAFPNKFQDVLVTQSMCRIGSFSEPEALSVHYAQFCGDSWEYDDDGDDISVGLEGEEVDSGYGYDVFDKAIAWMPLPKPYRIEV